MLPMAHKSLEQYFQLLARTPDPIDCDRTGLVEMDGCFRSGHQAGADRVGSLGGGDGCLLYRSQGSATTRGRIFVCAVVVRPYTDAGRPPAFSPIVFPDHVF